MFERLSKMNTIVEIINNPYQQRVKVLINGKAASVYSDIEKYNGEPFYYWCDRILKDIYEECNREPFILRYCSRKEENAIMAIIAKESPYCIEFTSSEHIRSHTLLDRIKMLNNIFKEEGLESRIHYSKRIVFCISELFKNIEKDLVELEVANSFCTINSHIEYCNNFNGGYKDDDIIFITDTEDISAYIDKLNIKKGFCIILGDDRKFLHKKDGVFTYRTTKEALFETIYECLLLSPLLEIFNRCIREIPRETYRRREKEFEKLQSIDIKVIPQIEQGLIEVGEKKRINFVSDISGITIDISKLHFSYSEKGIVRCDGKYVEGIGEGETLLSIMREGELIPCATIKCEVVKRNRINKIKIDEKHLVLGEGDSAKLNYMFMPPDADNVHLIKWNSDDENVAKIDQNGNIRAIKPGRCSLICKAEKVFDKCECTVLAHLKKIEIKTKEIIMQYGYRQEIEINTEPKNCIDDQIEISSLNMRIANVVGRTISAIGIGQTKIVVQNRQHTVRQEIYVRVVNEKEFKKIQKQNKKSSRISKKGFFKRLFTQMKNKDF